ncbi:MAG: hypothetical protein ACFFCQ_17865 [Promethearchaeota archaeon]
MHHSDTTTFQHTWINKSINFEKLYEKHPITDAVIIKVAIDSYKDIFNGLDPAPFKRRDLDPDLLQYLEDCSSDIPMKNPINLQFNVEEALQDEETEKKVKLGLTTYFSFMMYSKRRQLKRSMKKNAFNVIIAFIFLITAFLLEPHISNNLFLLTLLEGLFVGGWVFLWQAISSFAFQNRDIKHKYKEYQRFCAAPIHFKHTITN